MAVRLARSDESSRFSSSIVVALKPYASTAFTPVAAVALSVTWTVPLGTAMGPEQKPTGTLTAGSFENDPFVTLKVNVPVTGSVIDDDLQISMKAFDTDLHVWVKNRYFGCF